MFFTIPAFNYISRQYRRVQVLILLYPLSVFSLYRWPCSRYGTTIENLTDGTPDEGDGEVITLVVGIVATAFLSAVLVVYTKRILEGMVNEEQERQHLETGRGGGESRGGVQLPDGVRRTPIASLA